MQNIWKFIVKNASLQEVANLETGRYGPKSGVACMYRMYLCGFACLYVRMFVARANKVEGTRSWCLGTNEILASI